MIGPGSPTSLLGAPEPGYQAAPSGTLTAAADNRSTTSTFRCALHRSGGSCPPRPSVAPDPLGFEAISHPLRSGPRCPRQSTVHRNWVRYSHQLRPRRRGRAGCDPARRRWRRRARQLREEARPPKRPGSFSARLERRQSVGVFLKVDTSHPTTAPIATQFRKTPNRRRAEKTPANSVEPPIRSTIPATANATGNDNVSIFPMPHAIASPAAIPALAFSKTWTKTQASRMTVQPRPAPAPQSNPLRCVVVMDSSLTALFAATETGAATDARS